MVGTQGYTGRRALARGRTGPACAWPVGLVVLGLWLSLPGWTQAAITHVAERTIGLQTGVDSAASAAFTPGAGNLLVVTVQMWANVGTPAVVVTDNVNAGAYTQAFVRVLTADAKSGILQFYKNNVAGASTIITVNPTPATAWFITAISEWSGQDPTAAVLDVVTTTGLSNQLNPLLTTAAPGGASNAAVAVMAWTVAPRTVTPGAGWTQILEIEDGGAGGVNFVAMMWQVTTTATGISVNWTTSASTDGNIGVGVYRSAPLTTAPRRMVVY